MRGNSDVSGFTMAQRRRHGGKKACRKFTPGNSLNFDARTSSGVTSAPRSKPCFSCKADFRASATGWRMKFSGGQGLRRGRGLESSGRKSSTRFGGRRVSSPGWRSERLVGIIPTRRRTGCSTSVGGRAENVRATVCPCGARQLADALPCGVRVVSGNARARPFRRDEPWSRAECLQSR